MLIDPPELHYLIEPQVWARVEPDGRVTAGITALGAKLAGEIYMCRPKGAGVMLEQGRSMAVVELAKSIVSVKAPLSGEVVAVNARLAREPEIINHDPYGEGWLLVLQPSRLTDELAALVTGDAVAPAMAEHARLFREDVGGV